MSKRFHNHRPKPARGTRAGAPAGQTADPAAEHPGAPAADRPGSEPNRRKEIGGPSGLEPTRYGDWERNGICIDF
jgi:hypothetical protein